MIVLRECLLMGMLECGSNRTGSAVHRQPFALGFHRFLMQNIS